MRTILLVATLMLCATRNLGAAGPALIDSVGWGTLDLSPWLECLPDAEGRYTLADVQAAGLPWRAAAKPVTEGEGPCQQYWLRVRLCNRTPRLGPYLLTQSLFHGRVACYLPDATVPGGYRQLLNGLAVPPAQRAFNVPYFRSFETLLPQGDTLEVYFRVSAPMDLSQWQWTLVLASDVEGIRSLARSRETGALVLVGILLVLVLYNTLIYFVGKEKTYLYYSLSFLLVILYVLRMDSVDLVWWHLPLRWPWDLQGNVAICLVVVFYITFTRLYLGLERLLPAWDRWAKVAVRVLIFVNLPAYVLLTWPALVPDRLFFFAHIVLNLSFLFALAILLGITVVAYRKGTLLAKYFAGANMPTLLFFLIYLLQGPSSYSVGFLNLIPGNQFTALSLKIGVVFQAVAFSLALAGRLSILRSEVSRRQLEAEQAERQRLEDIRQLTERKNQELEQKVVERTAELSEANTKLNTTLDEVEAERRKSDQLLLNILPQAIAEELKAHRRAKPRHYAQVSVLFTDFKGFTQLAEQLAPEALLADLNHCFAAFDAICQRHGLEKIKTIGDAYMAAGGLPVPKATHALDAVGAALDMQRFMRDWQAQRQAEAAPTWALRIGIHSGPVVAGVVGTHKFAYDIWGDTVNLAARMEQASAEGRINISASTHALVKDHIPCSYRGKVAAKNKGELDMYFVDEAL